MDTETEHHGRLSCEIGPASNGSGYAGTLRFGGFEAGTISGSSPQEVRSQFSTICDMIDDGGQLRDSIIMTGYHNGAYEGDVLLVDGEIIGSWKSDDVEWYFFTPVGAREYTCAAPSPWMLHDLIIARVQKT
jgi:hypothetical protein